MSNNPQFHEHVKHIGIKFHFICELVSDGTVKLHYCPTEEKIADTLTIGLPSDHFNKLRHKAGVRSMPSCS